MKNESGIMNSSRHMPTRCNQNMWPRHIIVGIPHYLNARNLITMLQWYSCNVLLGIVAMHHFLLECPNDFTIVNPIIIDYTNGDINTLEYILNA